MQTRFAKKLLADGFSADRIATLTDLDMVERTRLRVGDRIRILRVPAGDLEQRERVTAEGVPDAGWTADTIERLIRAEPLVTIDRIDENGFAWFDFEICRADGRMEQHAGGDG